MTDGVPKDAGCRCNADGSCLERAWKKCEPVPVSCFAGKKSGERVLCPEIRLVAEFQ